MHRAGVCVLVLVMAAGCAGRFRVNGIVEHPAELPVRAFPPVAIAPAADPESTDLATRLAEHLAADGTPVVVGTSAMTTGTIRVDVGVRFMTSAVTQWGNRPENVCGPYGCAVRQVSYPYDVVSLVGEVFVRVVDPSNEHVLAQRTTRAEEIGSDDPARRTVLARRMTTDVMMWFDARQERIATRLPRIGGDDYDQAVRLANAGRWDESASALRAIRESPAFDERSVEQRARLLEALAIAIRFSEQARRTPVRSLGEALAIVDESQSLSGSSDGRRLRAAIAGQLGEARVLEVQRGSLGASTAQTFAVPEGYR